MSTFTATLQSFFTTFLVGQKAASHHTIAAYRDTFRMLLLQLHDATGTAPDAVEFTDVNAEAITSFLTYLEIVRKNTIRTRNARLAALHAFFTYAAYRHPEHADLIARVLAIKTKNTNTTVLTYLTRPEVDALLTAPDQNTATGRRDHVIILVFITTGLRVSELTGLTQQDLQLSKPAHLLCHGKGRKDRITPLNKETTRALQEFGAGRPPALPHDPLFTAQGSAKALGRDAIAARLRLYCAAAATTCPSLKSKTVTPHTLRHTTAMRMLDAGIDITTIALWLGHESTQATQAYLHADLGMKERAMTRIAPIGSKGLRFVPKGRLLSFLESL
ncbi:tyrosine-type recombinase/integrase [Cryobacterium psychrophilum]|uniref:Integrase n=1 Tax=Cryobacterium psychrophilum TaxID=41988 RepID=A0A4Y8KTS0_9MICO|nr:tyrosine-type recombinase/integrase [Cryobacterium psychrophilum]TDW29791.1 site-specific recombinase XerD [Cryobacterium psychrophilum]TFD81888.1 integrase [Cryobacterium psychrophilum]